MFISSPDGTERKPDRLEAFSDAVLAIAITLPVWDMPEETVAVILKATE